MQILKVISWVLGLLVVTLALLLLVAPTHVQLSRMVVIEAPASKVWGYLIYFREFNHWNAWKKADPGAKYSISGRDGHVGAVDTWKGDKIGEGQLEQVGLQPFTRVKQRLTFIRPWQATGQVTFSLSEAEGRTTVIWAFEADYPRPQNVLGLFMETSIKRDFEEGLENLKRLVERGRKP